MPSIRMLLFAVSILFAGLIAASSSVQARWQGSDLHPNCSGGYCPTMKDACESWSTLRGGIPWTSTEIHSDGGGATCHIQINPFLYKDPTFITCDAGETEHAGVPSGCLDRPIDPKSHGRPNSCPVGKNGSNPGTNNPISLINGNKYFEVVDFATAGPDVLHFTRHYNSRSLLQSSFGKGWRHTYSRNLSPAGGSWTTPAWIEAYRHTGQVLRFTKVGNDYVAPTDYDYALIAVGGEWELTDASGNVDRFDANGRLLWIETRNGYRRTMTYDVDGYLEKVSDNHSRELTFTYFTFVYAGNTHRQNYIVSMTDPDGRVYEYVRHNYGQRLDKVIYPDLSPQKPSVTYLYEKPGAYYGLTGIVDENGNQFATVEYDDQYRAITSKQAGDANKVTVTYDDVNNTRTVTNALGKQTKYHLTSHAAGLKLSQVEGLVSANCPASDSTFAYDSNGYVNSWTDREGNVTTYVNNARGLQTSRTEASGTPLARTITTAWHASYPLPTQIVRPGLTVDFTYDADGNLLTRTETDTTSHSVPYSTNGQTRVWTYTYTTAGQLKTVDGPLTGAGDTTTYDYDTSGYLTKVTDPLGHITDVVTVNGRGLPTSIEDPNGITSDLTYDARGRLLTRTVNPGAGEAVTTFTYDAVGQITKITLPDGSELNYAYDDAQRLTKVSNLDGEEIVYTLDLMGNITKEEIKDAGGTLKKTQTRTFDELGRMLKSIGAGTQETAFSYNKNDDLKTVTDPKSNVTTNAYDALNRLITVTDALTNDADTAYDAADNLTGVTDQRSLTTSYVHNGFGDVIRRTSPDTGITDYEYDKAANVTKKTDARGVVVNYAYDDASRITTKTFPASTSENVTYTYDDVTGGNYGKGRLTKIEDASGSTSYVYDARGNVITETRVIGAQSYVTSYVYDSADNLTQMTYPSGRIVTYLRDRLGRVAYVTTKKTGSDPEQFLASNIQYLPFGPISSITYGNGQRATLSYDQDYRITGIDTTDGTTTVQDLSYTYDLASNISGITDTLDTARNQTLDYDVLHRLTDATGVYGDIDYVYDAVGNRTSRVVTDGGVTTDTLTYAGTSNRLLTVATGGNTRTVTYTANGNITTDSRGSGFDYLYNHANRMNEVKENAATVATYTYNDLGQRVIKDLAGGAKTHFHFDLNGILIGESTDLGVSQREYITLAGLPIAVIDAGTTPTAPTETTQDNGDAGTSSTGTWNTLTTGTQHEGANYLTRENGDGTNAYTWAPTISTDGPHQVYVKYPADPNLGSKADYTVHHAQGSNTHTVDQRKDGGQWNLLGTYNLKAGQNHRVVLSDKAEAVPTTTDVIIDNTHVDAVATGTWNSFTQSSYYKSHWGTNYSWADSGDGTTKFAWPASAVPETGRYRVYARWVTHANHATNSKYTINHIGGTTTVPVDQVQFDATWYSLGVFDLEPGTGAIVELSNDANGQVVADAIRLVRETGADLHTPGGGSLAEDIADNTDGDVVITGSYTTHTVPGQYGSNVYQFAPSGSITSSITWPLKLPTAGEYELFGRWKTHSNRATDAKYVIHHDGGTTTVTVNQQINDQSWVSLGKFNLTPASNPKVVLGNDANGYVIVDAVRALRDTRVLQDIADNTDGDVVVTGSYTTHSVSGQYGSNVYQFAPAGSITSSISWPLSVPSAGMYELFGRWKTHANRATDAKYVVHHDGGTSTVTVNQQINDQQWVSLGKFDLTPASNPKIVLGNDANGYVIVDAVMARQDTRVHSADEIIVDNDDPVNVNKSAGWGSTGSLPRWGTNAYYTQVYYTRWLEWIPPLQVEGWYKVYTRWPNFWSNSSVAPHTIHHRDGSTTVNVNQKQDFGQWYPLGTYYMEPGQNHRVAVSTVGASHNTRLHADATRFVRVPSGSMEDMIVDNTDPSVVRVGTWSSSTWADGGRFWGSNFEYRLSGTGSETFTWPAPVTEQGRYRVYARWTMHAGFRTNAARYTVHHADGSSLVTMDQNYNGGRWMSLGVFEMAPGQNHRVVLDDNATDDVVADAIRFVRESNTRQVTADAIKIVPNTAEDALYVHADHLGTPQKMTDAAAAVVWDATYRPFGTEDAITGTATNEQRFPGQFRDAETGLHYNYFRDYDPAIGRYIQSDPIGLDGGLNTYAYVGGNPVLFYDPLGESRKKRKGAKRKKYKKPDNPNRRHGAEGRQPSGLRDRNIGHPQGEEHQMRNRRPNRNNAPAAPNRGGVRRPGITPWDWMPLPPPNFHCRFVECPGPQEAGLQPKNPGRLQALLPPENPSESLSEGAKVCPASSRSHAPIRKSRERDT